VIGPKSLAAPPDVPQAYVSAADGYGSASVLGIKITFASRRTKKLNSLRSHLGSRPQNPDQSHSFEFPNDDPTAKASLARPLDSRFEQQCGEHVMGIRRVCKFLAIQFENVRAAGGDGLLVLWRREAAERARPIAE
jgi:hypothetical protein